VRWHIARHERRHDLIATEAKLEQILSSILS
jgi:uncharacterized membrane protein YgcG